MRETSVERRLVAEVRGRGGICIKILPVVAGVPDRLVIMPGGRMYLVETKAPGGRVRPAQAVWHARAAALGVTVAVLRSAEEVIAWIRNLDR